MSVECDNCGESSSAFVGLSEASSIYEVVNGKDVCVYVEMSVSFTVSYIRSDAAGNQTSVS